MANLNAQAVVNSGLSPSYAAGSNGGDTCPCGDRIFLHCKNTSGGAIIVTIDDVNTPVPAGSAANNDNVVSVPATTGEKMIGPISADRFAQPAGGTPGRANITYDTNPPTGLTVACIAGP